MIKPRVIAAGGCHLPRWPHPFRPGICQGFQTWRPSAPRCADTRLLPPFA